MAGNHSEPGMIEARGDGAFPFDGLVITLAKPKDRLRRGDRLLVRDLDGEPMDIHIAADRPDGQPSVWYAVNPSLRHWLGWLERRDARRWLLRMEPFHLWLLDEMRAEALQTEASHDVARPPDE